MTGNYSRRAALAAFLSSLATMAVAQAPLVSKRPVARPIRAGQITPEMRQSLAQVVANSGVTGRVGIVLADAATGEVLELHDADVMQPPASVSKSITALYALEALGPGYRWKTRVLANGPILNGVLNGDLILSGGGNPNLVTDDLADLARIVAETGLRKVTGAFLVYDSALPHLDEIDDTQMDHLGYNPALSGLNLNFNRVYFEWKRQGANYTVSMDARSERYRPSVSIARMQVVERAAPLYTYQDGGVFDQWTVAKRALGNGGSRWLPVRYPALYAGEVFASFAGNNNLVLTAPVEVAQLPDAPVVAEHTSAELRDVLLNMMKYSTNLTAEAAGLAATKARTGQIRGLRTSALGMTQWVRARAGIAPIFADHSGLGDTSRMTAADMVKFLTAGGVRAQLYPIMKQIVLTDEDNKTIKNHPAVVQAKTGTLNFVSCLAGYIRTAGGRELAFAIFAADLEARERGKQAGGEQPAGSTTFNTKAKRLQQVLLQRWAALNDVPD
tara:strand:+ start:12539 stop:14041 length:1503 start_codon:yes stop_codon:yes gene_type:complete